MLCILITCRRHDCSFRIWKLAKGVLAWNGYAFSNFIILLLLVLVLPAWTDTHLAWRLHLLILYKIRRQACLGFPLLRLSLHWGYLRHSFLLYFRGLNYLLNFNIRSFWFRLWFFFVELRADHSRSVMLFNWCKVLGLSFRFFCYLWLICYFYFNSITLIITFNRLLNWDWFLLL
jgi:hypothetical protein